MALQTASGITYLHADHLGSTSVTSGAVSSSQVYYPYGSIRAMTGSAPTDFGFTGQRLDASDSLMYYGARYYDAALGRFVTADSVVPSAGNPRSMNRYSYANNNPLRYTDPNGNWPWDDLWTWIQNMAGGSQAMANSCAGSVDMTACRRPPALRVPSPFEGVRRIVEAAKRAGSWDTNDLPANPNGPEHLTDAAESLWRMGLAAQGFNPLGQTDSETAQALGIQDVRHADFVGYNEQEDKWLIAERHGATPDVVVEKMTNAMDALLGQEPTANASNIELKYYLNQDQYRMLTTTQGAAGGYLTLNGYLAWKDEDGNLHYELINGLKIQVLQDPYNQESNP